LFLFNGMCVVFVQCVFLDILVTFTVACHCINEQLDNCLTGNSGNNNIALVVQVVADVVVVVVFVVLLPSVTALLASNNSNETSAVVA